jgi:hypothetical protein
MKWTYTQASLQTSSAIKIRNDVSGTPSNTNLYSIAATVAADDSVGSGSSGLQRLAVNFSPIDLTAGTYWIGLSAATIYAAGDIGWSSMLVGPLDSPDEFVLNGDHATTTNGTYDLAFILYGDPITTPIPAALPLFATGLTGLGLLGWRRKRAQAA